MLRSQRILVIVALLVAAWLLHVNMCDWVINRPMMYWSAGRKPYANSVIFGWESSAAVNTNPAMTSGMTAGIVAYDVRFTGVLRQPDVGRKEFLLVGVLVPLALLFAAVYLVLGGRHARRVLRGLCTKCGYDLRGATQPLTKCPECGAVAAPPFVGVS